MTLHPDLLNPFFWPPNCHSAYSGKLILHPQPTNKLIEALQQGRKSMRGQDAAKDLTIDAAIKASRCGRRPKLFQCCLGRGCMRSWQSHRRSAQLRVRPRSLLRMTAVMPLQHSPGTEMLCGAAELLAQAFLPQCLCVHCTRHAHRGPQR